MRAIFARISRAEWIIVITFILLAAISYLIPIFYINIDQVIKGYLSNISAGFLVGVISFLFIDIGSAVVNPFREIRDFDLTKYIEDLGAMKPRRIRILETFTGLTESRYWEKVKQELIFALRSGSEIRILLSHPNSAGAEQRATELGSDELERGLKENLMRFYEFTKEVQKYKKEGKLGKRPGTIEVRLYKGLPAISMYMAENSFRSRAYVNYFPLKTRADALGVRILELSMNTVMGEWIMSKFEDLWQGSNDEKAPTIMLDEHMQLTIKSPMGDHSFYFAYDQQGDRVDYVHIFALIEDGRQFALITSPHEGEQDHLLTDLTLIIDGVKVRAEPHYVRDPHDIRRAIELINARYGWENDRWNNQPIVISFVRLKDSLI